MEMNARSGRGRSVLAIVAVLVGVLALGAGTAGARSVVYNNIVSPLPGNVASIGFEATSTSEFGGEVELAGTARKSPKVTVAMSAWGCQEGGVYTGETCKISKPHKKFHWPLTLNIYSVGAGNTVGTKLASVTKTFGMPYRPDSSKACTEAGDEGAWLDPAQPGAETIEKCFHGVAFTVKFHPTVSTPLPNNVILSVAYNTSNHGEHPVGSAPCQTTTSGCYYDSLNVGLTEASEKGLSMGADPTENWYVNSTWNEMYCGSSSSLGTFAPSGECTEGEQPAFTVETAGK
jgi:hypothetical protein